MSLMFTGNLHWSDGQERDLEKIIFYSQGKAIQDRGLLMNCYPEEIVSLISFDYRWEKSGSVYNVQLTRNGDAFYGSAQTLGKSTNEVIRCSLYRRTDQEILLRGSWRNGQQHFAWNAVVSLD